MEELELKRIENQRKKLEEQKKVREQEAKEEKKEESEEKKKQKKINLFKSRNMGHSIENIEGSSSQKNLFKPIGSSNSREICPTPDFRPDHNRKPDKNISLPG